MAASIRSRIVFTLVSALIVAGLVASWATYHSTRSELSGLFDEQLRHTALELIERGDNDIKHTILVGQSPEMRFLVQIYDASTNRVYLSRRTDALPLAESVGFSDIKDEAGTEWRQFTATVGTKIVQVAQPMNVRDRLAVSSAMNIVQPMFILIPFLAIAIWFVIVQALQPLNRTARAVAKRSPSSMTPIDTEGLPYELKSLVDAINSLMRRLGDSLSAQQRFASDAAHELRTPLAAIKLQAQLLSRAKDPETRAKYASRLQEGVARATRLVQQLLTIARLDPDAHDKPMSEFNLATVAQASVEELSVSAEAKGITLTHNCTDVTMLGMKDAIGLMITNLTDNAIRYTPEGGRIEVAVRDDGDCHAVITVTDNGPGIAPEERTRVFERFYRALGTKVSGTGLGLAIVSRIVQMHNGIITINDGFVRPPHDGEPEGFGAQFLVRIPLCPAANQAAKL